MENTIENTMENTIRNAVAQPCRRDITQVIVHCTATRAGVDIGAAAVDRWHRQRGFSGIGYHFVVRLDGSVECGRPLDRVGAHCLGHNRGSVGVAYAGGLDAKGRPADTRTPAQRRSLTALMTALCGRFNDATVHGHREFANKACPCFDAAAEYAHLSCKAK